MAIYFEKFSNLQTSLWWTSVRASLLFLRPCSHRTRQPFNLLSDKWSCFALTLKSWRWTFTAKALNTRCGDIVLLEKPAHIFHPVITSCSNEVPTLRFSLPPLLLSTYSRSELGGDIGSGCCWFQHISVTISTQIGCCDVTTHDVVWKLNYINLSVKRQYLSRDNIELDIASSLRLCT